MSNASDPVLDASAVLAVIFGEAGADRVAGHLPGARISAVNAAEVMIKLVDLGMPEGTVDAMFEGLQLTAPPFEMAHAREATHRGPSGASARKWRWIEYGPVGAIWLDGTMSRRAKLSAGLPPKARPRRGLGIAGRPPRRVYFSTNSTRRFFARPDSLALLASGA